MKHFIPSFLLLILPLTLNATESIAYSLKLTQQQLSNYKNRNITLNGILKLYGETEANQPLMEFSGLAWGQDDSILYALSDRGYIVHLEPVFEDDQLTDVLLHGKYSLMDDSGKALKETLADSEGLALINANNGIDNDTELVICFERSPRIGRYDVYGKWIADITINNTLANISHYEHVNKSLEAITEHPQFQFISASERPLKQTSNNLFAHDKINASEWEFETSNKDYGSLVGLTTLPDGNIIALERIFQNIFTGVTSVIHSIEFDDNDIVQTQLISLKPADGVFNDNFEAISWHRDNRFFMISDDNDNLLQRSILIYFSIPSLDNT